MNCSDGSVSGFVSFVFIYRFALKKAAELSNCTSVDQRTVILVCVCVCVCVCVEKALKHLKPVVRNNKRSLLSKEMLLLHDNARP
jgi:hypothetical protein